jgi:glycosyltransferase involved in cell wall biosynthesis
LIDVVCRDRRRHFSRRQVFSLVSISSASRQSAHILFVMADLQPSGAETMLQVLGPLLARDGIKATVLSTGEREAGPFAQALEAAGYTVRHLPFRRSPAFGLAFWRLCRELAPDVVHIHCERANFWFALAARFAGVRRLVRTVHARFAFEGRLRLKRRIQRQFLRIFLGVRSIAHSRAVVETERQLFGNLASLVPPWIDFSRFSPVLPEGRAIARQVLGLPEESLVLALVGSCQPVKNHELVLKALAKVRRQMTTDGGAGLILLHAGHGCGELAEKALAAELGIDSNVRFMGAVAQVEHVLHAADLFLMPSLREGFGIAALEALACGVPAVLCEGSGLESHRVFGEAVLWCQPDLTSLARQISAFAALPAAERKALALTAPQIARQNFNVENSWYLHKELYGLPAERV